MQARVIEIYQKAGFATWRSRRRRNTSPATASRSEFRRANPEGWDKAQPLVKTHLAELARHYHASAQKTKASADYAGGDALVPRVPGRRSPKDADRRRRTTSCSPSCCSRTSDSPRPRSSTRRRPTATRRDAKSADSGYAALLAYVAAAEEDARRRGCRRCSAPASPVRCASPPPGPPTRAPARCSPDAAEKLYALRDGARARWWRSG